MSMSDPSLPSIYTRQSLLERLRNWDDGPSWKDFFDTYWKLIYGVARKAGLSDSEAQDVVQETIIAVARKMPEFRYDRSIGTFKGWLLKLTRWRITDHLRKKARQHNGQWLPREIPAEPDVLEQYVPEAGFDLEGVWETEWKEQLLETALDRVRERADCREFQMFHLLMCKRVPAREVARHLGAKLAEVYFAKYKISAAVKKEVRRIERQMV